MARSPIELIGGIRARRLARRARAAERFVDGQLVQLHGTAGAALNAMHDAIASARSQVLLEMYWFGGGRVGKRFAQVLEAAAQRGVQVVVLYDAWGSFGTRTELFEGLRSAGVDVAPYRPLRRIPQQLKLGAWTRRNHRKLLIIDQERAFVGGVNLADEWLPAAEGGGGFRDEMLEIRGPIAGQLTDAFSRSYSECRALALPSTRRRAAACGSAKVAVLTQAGFRGRQRATRAYQFHIQQATRCIYLANAYFIPPRHIARALANAARRGVDVRIMLPGESDVPLISYASRATWCRLLEAGVRVYEWQPGVLHSKTAVVDGNWCTGGSLNLDSLSLHNNVELNVAILDAELGQALEQHFLADLSQCKEVSLSAFRHRPAWGRLLEEASRPFRDWL